MQRTVQVRYFGTICQELTFTPTKFNKTHEIGIVYTVWLCIGLRLLYVDKCEHRRSNIEFQMSVETRILYIYTQQLCVACLHRT